MKIVGIGIDIVEIRRIKKKLFLFQDKFIKKILTYNEILQFQLQKYPERFLAKRFSAKEAVSKAFGIGFQNGITFKQFEIYKNAFGKPSLHFFQKAEELKNKLKIKKVHLSITDEKNYACAIVIIEK